MARILFFLILFAWNAYLLVGLPTHCGCGTPSIQSATNNVVLSVELDLFIVGNLLIVGTVRLSVRSRAKAFGDGIVGSDSTCSGPAWGTCCATLTFDRGREGATFVFSRMVDRGT